MSTLLSRFFLLILTIFLCHSAWGITWDLSKQQDNWNYWGDGKLSKEKNGAHFQVEFGQEEVLYREFPLEEGLYSVTVELSGQDLQLNEYRQSFDHFIDAGEGIKYIKRDFEGSFSQGFLTYTVHVSKQLNMWWRLRSMGDVWLKKVQINRARGPQKVTWLQKKGDTMVVRPLINCEQAEVGSRKWSGDKLLSQFPGDFTKLPNGGFAIEPHSYEHFNKSLLGKIPFINYRYLTLTIDYKPKKPKSLPTIYFVLGDGQSKNYWQQLNLSTILHPGLNTISLDLHRFVGERGSVRHFRRLNYKDIRFFWLGVEPEKDGHKEDQFVLHSLALESPGQGLRPEGLRLYDFATNAHLTYPCSYGVLSRHLYRPERGYGYLAPEFFRVVDGEYGDGLLRDFHRVKKGQFRVDLPDGDYRGVIFAEGMNRWDPSFYTKRLISLQGKPLEGLLRARPKDFLDDFLRFSPKGFDLTSHPFDRVWWPFHRQVPFAVKVTNGHLIFELEGRPDGMPINALVLWPNKLNAAAQVYLKDLKGLLKAEFDKKMRRFSDPIKTTSKAQITPTSSNGTHHPSLWREEKVEFPAEIMAFPGEILSLPFQMMAPQKSKVLFKIAHQLKGLKVSTFLSQAQWVSRDLNHQTYRDQQTFLRPVESPFYLPVNQVQLFWPTLEIPESLAGQRGKFTFSGSIDGRTFEYTTMIKISSDPLPKLPMSIGYLGLNSVELPFIKIPKMEEKRRFYRRHSMKELAKYGLNTFSGIPGPIWDTQKKVIDWQPFDQFLQEVKSHSEYRTLFSYLGEFPFTLLDNDGPFRDHALGQRKKWVEKGLAKIKAQGLTFVHQFADEPAGYRDHLKEMTERAKWLKGNWPGMSLGAFTSFHDQVDWRQFFGLVDNPSLTLAPQEFLRQLVQGKKEFGIYNWSPRNWEDPRLTMGVGAYFAYIEGARHYLEWHSSAIFHLPYYDLDGRESDNMILYPHVDGVYTSIRLVQTAMGLADFRWLLLAEKKLGRQKVLQMLLTWPFLRSWQENLLLNRPTAVSLQFFTELRRKLATLLTIKN